MPLSSGRPESPFTPHGFAQIRLYPLNRLISRHNHLRDTLPRLDDKCLFPEIMEDDPHFATVTRVNGSRCIRKRDAILQRQPAAWSQLRLVSGRQLNCDTCRHQPGIARRKNYRLHRIEVHARIFVRPVRITRQNRIVM